LDERGTAELPQDGAAAAASFSRAKQIDPGSVRALEGCAYAAERQGLDEKALTFLLEARKVEPENVAVLTHFGMVCIRRDLGIDAVAALNRAHLLAPTNNLVLYELARAQISVENWQQAHDLFLDFSTRVPSFAPTYYALGWLDIKLAHVEQAKTELQHCLQLEPKLTDARYELAQLSLDNGDLATGEALLRTVLKEKPNHAKANVAMGDLLMRQGKVAEANRALRLPRAKIQLWRRLTIS